MAIGQGTVKRAIDKNTKYISSHHNSSHQLDILIGNRKNGAPPKNADIACVESETLHKHEVQPDHDTFFKLLDISTCFYGKQQLSPSEVSQYTSIDESEVRDILDDWYQKVVISPGIGDKYWMTERDKKQLWDKILVPTWSEWEKNFPGQKILCPPGYFNPHLKANITPN